MAKQNTQKINEWKALNVQRINLEFRTDTGILEKIEQLVSSHQYKSRQAFIIDAVKEKLERMDKEKGADE